jgi:hypothetical protein
MVVYSALMTFTCLKDYCNFTRNKLAVAKADIHDIVPPYFINGENGLQIWRAAVDRTYCITSKGQPNRGAPSVCGLTGFNSASP